MIASGERPALRPMAERLRARLRSFDTVVVALSGGVDSTVLAAVAVIELGERALAVTGVSPSLAAVELAAIRRFCAARALAHATVLTREMQNPGYTANSPERCYFCKRELFLAIGELARARGFALILDGTNADELRGHRPGKRAAAELEVVSPFVDIGATKDEIRALARDLGLEVADKPASPCLSSRIAYGVPVTVERLTRVGRAESRLRELGFHELRVRLHDSIARIEVPKHELSRVLEHADRITRELQELGFVYVTLDLAGLRSGSLLEAVAEERQ